MAEAWAAYRQKAHKADDIRAHRPFTHAFFPELPVTASCHILFSWLAFSRSSGHQSVGFHSIHQVKTRQRNVRQGNVRQCTARWDHGKNADGEKQSGGIKWDVQSTQQVHVCTYTQVVDGSWVPFYRIVYLCIGQICDGGRRNVCPLIASSVRYIWLISSSLELPPSTQWYHIPLLVCSPYQCENGAGLHGLSASSR